MNLVGAQPAATLHAEFTSKCPRLHPIMPHIKDTVVIMQHCCCVSHHHTSHRTLPAYIQRSSAADSAVLMADQALAADIGPWMSPTAQQQRSPLYAVAMLCLGCALWLLSLLARAVHWQSRLLWGGVAGLQRGARHAHGQQQSAEVRWFVLGFSC